MKFDNLCKMLELPSDVVTEMGQYRTASRTVVDDGIWQQLRRRECWGQAIAEMEKRIGEDMNGFCILAELLECACRVYADYQRIGIEDTVFIQTMKFCTRFINEHKKVYGDFAFRWAWWFPRQLALQEFRIGELEFEFVDAEDRQISIHIPSDANLNPQSVKQSFAEYRAFLHRFYPDWESVAWNCESWLLSPALKQLLPKTSNIILFQELFEVESVDYDSMAVLDWVYPGEKCEFADLSEQTSLQKKMKKFLLDGKKVGWAKGKVINFDFPHF